MNEAPREALLVGGTHYVDNIKYANRKRELIRLINELSGKSDFAAASAEGLISPVLTGLPGLGPNSFRVTVAGNIIKAPYNFASG